MAHEITVARAAPVRLAVYPTEATPATLGKVITGSPVWAFLRAKGIKTPGHNIVVYRTRQGEAPSPGTFHVEIGADVLELFAEADGVVNATTPEGMSATARHVGSYDGIGRAHDAISAWARANGRKLAGPSWEVYGHWSDDPSKLTTDVFYLLAD